MRILALSSFPVNAAATRFRVAQFIEPFKDLGHEIVLSPFLTNEQFRNIYLGGGSVRKISSLFRSILRRVSEIGKVRKFDVIFIQREAMIFGPAFFEWIYQSLGKLPMVLDLDDATYIPYISPSYGRLGSYLKFFGKTDRLINRADLVICGNRFIAEYVEKRGTRAVIVPTIVDTDVFKPKDQEHPVPIIGWVGTHSTFPFLERLLPALSKLANEHRFILKVVGSGRKDLKINGFEIQNYDWELQREVKDFQSLDIGLYPLDAAGSLDEAWLAGKSGFKAIQYLACGTPFVMSPVGVCAELGIPDETHFNAESLDDWYNSIDTLLSKVELRQTMGKRGREYALTNYNLPKWSTVLAEALRSVERH